MQQLMAHYALDRSTCLYLNFEDPRLSTALDYRTLDLVANAFEAGVPELPASQDPAAP